MQKSIVSLVSEISNHISSAFLYLSIFKTRDRRRRHLNFLDITKHCNRYGICPLYIEFVGGDDVGWRVLSKRGMHVYIVLQTDEYIRVAWAFLYLDKN
jgi:hypothetical protein